MWLLLTFLILSALAMAGFVVTDAIYAFDGDPSTHSLSEKIKAWRHGHSGRTFLLAATIFELVLIPFYLFIHLVLEVV